MWVVTLCCIGFLTTGGSLGHAPTPLDGVNVWNTISKGEPSPRKEILLNIDVPEKETTQRDDLPAITIYEGIALRAGDMKLMMSVPNVTWYKPPELGGNLDTEVVERDTPRGIIEGLDWLQVTKKVYQHVRLY